MAEGLKGLHGFEGDFKANEFLSGKKLAAIECKEWRETNDGLKKSGAILGTKVTVVILEDKTTYQPSKDGTPISNRYAQLTVKVRKVGLSIPVDTIVELVNPTAKVWGDYRNKLSITADDVRPVAAAGKVTP